MANIFYTQRGKEVKLWNNPFGRGGEGNVFKIENPIYRNMLAKIYHPKERTQQRQDKLNYLIQNPPFLKDPFSIVFPKELLFEANGNFMGFIMPLAKGNFDLSSLCSLKISSRMTQEWHRKFLRQHLQGMRNRVKVCYNLAAALSQIHETEQYVIADLKPENIKINLNGTISMIDLDSIEVIEDNKLLFAANKLTPEYAPPERIEVELAYQFIDETWDRFSLALIFYKILFGLHPYTGTPSGAYSGMVSHSQKIQAGLFPLGKMREHFSVIPKPHEAFFKMPTELRKAFLDCFEAGHEEPDQRPSASQWSELLYHLDLSQENVFQEVQVATRNQNPSTAVPINQLYMHDKNYNYFNFAVGFGSTFTGLGLLAGITDNITLFIFGVAYLIDGIDSHRYLYRFEIAGGQMVVTRKKFWNRNNPEIHYIELAHIDMLTIDMKGKNNSYKKLVKIQTIYGNKQTFRSIMSKQKLENMADHLKKKGVRVVINPR